MHYIGYNSFPTLTNY